MFALGFIQTKTKWTSPGNLGEDISRKSWVEQVLEDCRDPVTYNMTLPTVSQPDETLINHHWEPRCLNAGTEMKPTVSCLSDAL